MSTEIIPGNHLLRMDGLSQALDIEIVEASGERVVMRMPVTSHHRQPFGFLHGGASLALAEHAASIGACLNCPEGMAAFGQQLNASHLRSLREGTLVATAAPLHVGRTSQVWKVEIRDEREKLICIALCTLAVVQVDVM